MENAVPFNVASQRPKTGIKVSSQFRSEGGEGYLPTRYLSPAYIPSMRGHLIPLILSVFIWRQHES